MSIHIIHVSDIHYDERNDAVTQRLAPAIKKEEPDFIVCTGDLVSQPFNKNVAAGKQWLETLATTCGVPGDKVLIIPGNHDYGFWGSLGISFLSGMAFRSAFREKRSKKVVAFEQEKLIFIHIDSNPTILDLARGRVSRRRLRQTKRELDALPADTKDRSTKIALIHHHCLPVYNEKTGDRFLLLKNSQAVIEFFADNGINLVLHGHKHRATHSLLSIGGVGVKNRVVEILAAGTAMKDKDYEDRGHNFNLIAIDESGFRSITQFFSKPAGAEFIPAEKSYDFSREYFDQLYEDNRAKQQFEVERLHWDMSITLEGDRFNEMSYSGFKATPLGFDVLEYSPPEYTVDVGSIPGAQLDAARSSPGITLQELPRKDQRHLEFKIVFPESPNANNAAEFVIQSWDLNACALTEAEFWMKHPAAKEAREYEEKEIDGAIENFTWQVSFPAQCVIEDVRFEVFDQAGAIKQKKLTEILRSSFVFSRLTNNALVNLRKPPSGYRYRISWSIPKSTNAPLDIPVRAQLDFNNLSATLLAFRKRDPNNPSKEMLRTLAILESYKQTVAERVAKENGIDVDEIRLETSLMVYDHSTKPGELRIVAATLMQNPHVWNFSLVIGDGNAGRAYKGNILRLWFADSAKVQGNLSQWYVPGLISSQHKFLCSIPLRHPDCPHLIMGVLNFGTFDETTSRACRCLDREGAGFWLVTNAHSFVLTRLLEEFTL